PGTRPRRPRDRARRAEAYADPAGRRRGAAPAPLGVETASAPVHSRLRSPLPRPRAAGQRRVRLRLPARPNTGTRRGHGGAVAQLTGKKSSRYGGGLPTVPGDSTIEAASFPFHISNLEVVAVWHHACVVSEGMDWISALWRDLSPEGQVFWKNGTFWLTAAARSEEHTSELQSRSDLV